MAVIVLVPVNCEGISTYRHRPGPIRVVEGRLSHISLLNTASKNSGSGTGSGQQRRDWLASSTDQGIQRSTVHARIEQHQYRKYGVH
jgi:hypothetical protein